jgi:prepilin-type processing-associated H-X9-DG protein
MDMQVIWYSGYDTGYWNDFWALRHSGGMNTLFVDGHTKLMQVGDLPVNSADIFWSWEP